MATFREVTAYSGVDENLPSGGQGIVIPSGGSTLVILEDGRGLDVRSTVPSKVQVYEFKKRRNEPGRHKTPRILPRRCDDSMRILGVSSGSRPTLRWDLTR